MFLLSEKNVEQNHDIKVANKYLKHVAELKCLGKQQYI